jgi:hypothetical protein
MKQKTKKRKQNREKDRTEKDKQKRKKKAAKIRTLLLNLPSNDSKKLCTGALAYNGHVGSDDGAPICQPVRRRFRQN